MAEFDPDAYLKDQESGFDPDAYLKDQGIDTVPLSTKLEAGLKGFGEAASLGYIDELSALTEKPMFALMNLVTGQDVKPDDYETAKKYYAQESKQLEKEAPIASGVGKLAGGLTSGLAMAPIMGASGATALGRTGVAAAKGAALGAAQDIPEDGSITDRLTGAAIGGLTGGLFQGGAEVAPKIASTVSQKTGDIADWLAAKALGAERGTIKKMGAEKVKGLGRYALEEGLLTPLSSTEDVIERNLAQKSLGGEKMGEVYKAIDEAKASTFNPLETAAKVEEELGGFYRSPIMRGETKQLENTLESILMRGDKPLPITEAQKLKEELGRVANWKNNLVVSEKEKMARQAYGIVSGEIDKAVEAGAKTVGSEDLLGTLKKGKELFGKATSAEELLTNKLAREQGNKMFGITDWMAMGAGGAASLITGGAAAIPTAMMIGAKKLAEKYGAQSGALAADKISKALLKEPKWAEIARTNPQVFSSFVTNLSNKFGGQDETSPPSGQDMSAQILNKASGSKYADVLNKANQQGQQSLGAAHYILQQRDPEYRKMMTEDGG